MNIFFTYLPYFISFLIGYFFIVFFQNLKNRLPFSFHLFLASGLGLGISAQTVFLSFAFFGYLNKPFVIVANVVVFTVLIIACLFKTRGKIKPLINTENFTIKEFLPYIIFLIFSYPLWNHSHFYVYGGWDAWATWNLKSKILFLSQEGWQTIFDPVLWRSSPHYPLLLPFINCWGWIFSDTTEFITPVTTSFLFSFTTVGLLLSGLIHITKSYYAILCTTLLLSSSMFVKLSLSQYADIVVAYYLLAGLICLLIAKRDLSKTYALLSGAALGFLSFSKGEGLIAAVIIFALAPLYFFWKAKPSKSMFLHFFGAGCLASLVTIIFTLVFSPENQTFINGLFSDTDPVSFYRLKATFSFILVELVSPTWNGIWIVLIAGLILSSGRCFNSNAIIFPAFLLGYILIISAYYFINTYFGSDRILWWLQVSLHRLMYATLPSVVFWVFYSLWQLPKPNLQQKTPQPE